MTPWVIAWVVSGVGIGALVPRAWRSTNSAAVVFWFSGVVIVCAWAITDALTPGAMPSTYYLAAALAFPLWLALARDMCRDILDWLEAK